MTQEIFTGRTRKPAWKKWTGWFWWWWMNDDDPTPPDWYHGAQSPHPLYTGPEWPSWRRWLTWYVIRNPLHNFNHFVLGVKDRNFTVVGTGSVTDKVDTGQTGWCWCIIQRGPEIWVPRLYVSYSAKHWSGHIGWMWDGAFGIRIL